MNKIHHGDCLEFMKQIPDEYFDLVFTDVPYNVGKDYGIYKDSLTDFDYINWLSNVIYQLKRISREQIIYPSKKYFLETWNILGRQFQQIVFTTSTSGALRYGHSNQFTSILVSDHSVNGRVPNHYHNVPMPHDGFIFHENNLPILVTLLKRLRSYYYRLMPAKHIKYLILLWGLVPLLLYVPNMV